MHPASMVALAMGTVFAIIISIIITNAVTKNNKPSTPSTPSTPLIPVVPNKPPASKVKSFGQLSKDKQTDFAKNIKIIQDNIDEIATSFKNLNNALEGDGCAKAREAVAKVNGVVNLLQSTVHSKSPAEVYMAMQTANVKQTFANVKKAMGDDKGKQGAIEACIVANPGIIAKLTDFMDDDSAFNKAANAIGPAIEALNKF